MYDINFCSKCGTKISDASKFCPECGNQLHKNEYIEQNDNFLSEEENVEYQKERQQKEIAAVNQCQQDKSSIKLNSNNLKESNGDKKSYKLISEHDSDTKIKGVTLERSMKDEIREEYEYRPEIINVVREELKNFRFSNATGKQFLYLTILTLIMAAVSYIFMNYRLLSGKFIDLELIFAMTFALVFSRKISLIVVLTGIFLGTIVVDIINLYIVFGVPPSFDYIMAKFVGIILMSLLVLLVTTFRTKGDFGKKLLATGLGGIIFGVGTVIYFLLVSFLPDVINGNIYDVVFAYNYIHISFLDFVRQLMISVIIAVIISTIISFLLERKSVVNNWKGK